MRFQSSTPAIVVVEYAANFPSDPQVETVYYRMSIIVTDGDFPLRKLCRMALLSLIVLLPVPPASILVSAAGAAVPAADATAKKKNKKFRAKKFRKEKVLKGRHNSHKKRPA
jgi:hypothetical protein